MLSCVASSCIDLWSASCLPLKFVIHFIIIMYAAKFNANVSSNPKISAESRDDISKLYIVNRFYNTRSHAGQRSLGWQHFAFLFYKNGKRTVML